MHPASRPLLFILLAAALLTAGCGASRSRNIDPREMILSFQGERMAEVASWEVPDESSWDPDSGSFYVWESVRREEMPGDVVRWVYQWRSRPAGVGEWRGEFVSLYVDESGKITGVEFLDSSKTKKETKGGE